MTMLNKKHTEATKKIMSEKSKGNKSFSGRKHSEETKEKLRRPRPKRQGQPAWNKGTGQFKTRKEKDTHFHLKKYGIDAIGYNNILETQNYVCAICLKKEIKIHPLSGITSKLSVDHDHKSGKIRGLLCSKCNFAIGQLNDDPYLCQRAAQYLLNN